MTPATFNRCRRYRERGFTLRDIASLTGCRFAEVRDALKTAEPRTLDEHRHELMKAVPRWWAGTADEYQNCVNANFPE